MEISISTDINNILPDHIAHQLKIIMRRTIIMRVFFTNFAIMRQTSEFRLKSRQIIAQGNTLLYQLKLVLRSVTNRFNKIMITQ